MSENKSSDVKNAETEGEGNQIFEYKNLDAFLQDGFKTLMEATRTVNLLPKDRDYDFYMTHESYDNFISNAGNHILGLVNKIMRNNDLGDNIKNRAQEERVELIVEANDVILERVAITIDEMNGLRQLPKPPMIQTVSAELPVNGAWNRMNKFSINSSIQEKSKKGKLIHLLTAQNIVRPQKFFKDTIENANKYPWRPRITEKPNSLKPLALYIEETEFGECYANPYEFELDRFVPPEEFLQKCDPQRPKSIQETPLYEINTREQLNDLLEELRKHKEIAIDLEHHSYRSFMGITCLMQISTVDNDYLIDTLALRDSLWILNEVFTKPSILKIFHGADMDILWLQRDLSLYIVNMFDTHKAAKQLEYSGLSLSYLLNRFCSFVPNKQFQLADWRIRPLPEELKSYAREDTHYLIYIYQMLKNELLKKGNQSDNVLKCVFQASTDICKKIYVKPQLTETTHLDFYRKCKRLFDNRQMFALKELYGWRDAIAREQDESTGYVLPNHMLLQISETLPREVQGILACCNPIPPLVRAYSLELHHIILKAREQSLQKPIMKEENRSASTKESTKLNIDSLLHCPHDLTRLPEFRDDLPTLLGTKKNIIDNKQLIIEQNNSKCSIFDSSDEPDVIPKTVSDLKFLSPYERYKLIKPFIQAEEAKQQAAKEAAKEAAKKDGQKQHMEDVSIEDRIAMLHEHFIKERDAHWEQAREVELDDNDEEILHPQKPLIEMGGSKKRKRDHSAEGNNYKQEYNLQTSIPHNPNKKKRGAHRGGRGGYGNNSVNETKPNKKQFTKNGKRRGNFGNQTYGDPQQKVNQGGPPPYKKVKNEYNQGGPPAHGNVGKKHFQPFDYSRVDFNEFQGGAGGARRGAVGSNFRGKGKRNNRGKANNRSFTFDNNGGNKRGRGR